MPNIPSVPIKPVVKPQASLKAIIPTTAKPPIQPLKITPKVTYTGIRVAPGGLEVYHTSEVIDNSNDKTQYLPFVASCRTCGFQSRVKDKSTAEDQAKGHVGL